MIKTIASLLAASIVLAGCTAGNSDPVVAIEQGTLRGVQADGINRYLGIPYAAPPVGALRWKAPQPAAGWEGERDASAYGADCIQFTPGGPRPAAGGSEPPPTSEDCLTLNIWTPEAAEGPLPVMFWIHGGGHNFGAGSQPSFDGTELAKQGVVLVTINYRLGALGFMAHPALSAEAPYHSSGNYGILDQIAALKWVQANIAAFGGDPANVTIFGESAGSGAVNILQASPLAKGLFAKAIGESTSQFDPDGGLMGQLDLAGAEKFGADFAAKRGATDLAGLRALPVEKITADAPLFWPTEEDDYVLPQLVYTTFEVGRQNDVPTLVGSNSDEGSTIKVEWVKRAEAADKAAYDRLYGEFDDQLRQSATDAVQWQARVWAQLQAQTGKQKAWLYWFDQPWSGRKQDGAFHGAEIVYVFRTLDSVNQPWTADDRSVSKLMSSYWVNFARTGDPNGNGLPHWPSYDPADPKLMRIAPDAGVIATPRPEAQQFLDAYFAARR